VTSMGHAYWFKPKKFGYGATPTTWEGWAVTAVYCILLWVSVAVIATHRSSSAISLTSMSAIVVATIALFVIGIKKTEGRWGWNAGAKQISGKND
jgi:hypothetical protein